MLAIRGIFDGKTIRPLEPVPAGPNGEVIIAFLGKASVRSGFEPTRVRDVAGCLRYRGRRKSLRELNEAIARGIKERWA